MHLPRSMKIITILLLATSTGFWCGLLVAATAINHEADEYQRALQQMQAKDTRDQQEACVVTTHLYNTMKRSRISREVVEKSRRHALEMCKAAVGEKVDVSAEA